MRVNLKLVISDKIPVCFGSNRSQAHNNYGTNPPDCPVREVKSCLKCSVQIPIVCCQRFGSGIDVIYFGTSSSKDFGNCPLCLLKFSSDSTTFIPFNLLCFTALSDHRLHPATQIIMAKHNIIFFVFISKMDTSQIVRVRLRSVREFFRNIPAWQSGSAG